MARSFNGSSDYITTTLTTLSWFPFTVSAWVYKTVAGVYQNITAPSTGAQGVEIRVNPSEQIEFLNANLANLGTSTGTIPLNTWTHIAVVWAGNSVVGSNIVFYINGSASGTGTATSTSFGAAAQEIGGQSGTTNIWNGNLAELCIWKRALNAGEVALVANTSNRAWIVPANIINYWPLLGTASPEIDYVGGQNGTLTGTGSAADPSIPSWSFNNFFLSRAA